MDFEVVLANNEPIDRLYFGVVIKNNDNLLSDIDNAVGHVFQCMIHCGIAEINTSFVCLVVMQRIGKFYFSVCHRTDVFDKESVTEDNVLQIVRDVVPRLREDKVVKTFHFVNDVVNYYTEISVGDSAKAIFNAILEAPECMINDVGITVTSK